MKLINNRNTLAPLFEKHFYDSMLFGYFEGLIGEGYADNEACPKTVIIRCGDFYFLAGEIKCVDEILEISSKTWETIFITDKPEWITALEKAGAMLNTNVRFHTMINKSFDKTSLLALQDKISEHDGFCVRPVDEELYMQALENGWSKAFVCNFSDYTDYSAHGFGYAVCHNGRLVCAASTYGYYSKGVEVEIATDENYRRRGLASIVAAAFVIECDKRGLVVHWDAGNTTSLKIAQKVGLEKADEYESYVLTIDN